MKYSYFLKKGKLMTPLKNLMLSMTLLTGFANISADALTDSAYTFIAYRNVFIEQNSCATLCTPVCNRICNPLSSAMVLEISSDSQAFTADKLVFTYYSSLFNVTLLTPSIGPNEGNTAVTVSGEGFVNTGRVQSENVLCKFGTLIVQGAYYSNSTRDYVVCVSPSAWAIVNWNALTATGTE